MSWLPALFAGLFSTQCRQREKKGKIESTEFCEATAGRLNVCEFCSVLVTSLAALWKWARKMSVLTPRKDLFSTGQVEQGDYCSTDPVTDYAPSVAVSHHPTAFTPQVAGPCLRSWSWLFSNLEQSWLWSQKPLLQLPATQHLAA